jgi:hypothetical protein
MLSEKYKFHYELNGYTSNSGEANEKEALWHIHHDKYLGGFTVQINSKERLKFKLVWDDPLPKRILENLSINY